MGSKDVKLYQSTDNIVQRSSLVLKDVCYYIDAHFELTKDAGKEDAKKSIITLH